MKRVNKINWSHPGDNRYTGPIAAAIRHYEDIPHAVRERLVARADARQYDEMVDIDATGIRGKEWGYTNLRQMYFGTNIRAEEVSRDGWPFDQLERGLVYTEEGITIIIPLVCGNVARVDRVPLATLPLAPLLPKGTIIGPGLRAPKLGRVPEPSTLALLAPALLAAFILRRRNVRRLS